MKFTKIALAVATIAMAQNASAVEVYMSGASALRDVIPQVMDKICQPAANFPRALYEAGATISGTKTSATATPASTVNVDNDRRVFTCHTHSSTTSAAVATDLGVNADQDLVVYWSNEIGDSAAGSSGTYDKLLGGSVTGIAPLLNGGATVNFLDYTNTTTPPVLNGNADVAFGTANGNTVYGVSVKGFGFVGATKYVVNVQKSGIASDIGVSDVEPALFTGTYKNVPTTVGTSTVPTAWSSFDVTPLTSSANFKPAFVGGFGVIVGDNVTGVSNLSQEQLAQILAGTITNWSVLGGPSLTIKVCTRAPGSGTKATFNQLVSRLGCKTNAVNGGFEYGLVSANAVSTAGFRYSTAKQVREGATTGDVTTCMADGKNASGLASATNGAIGIIGLDSAASLSLTGTGTTSATFRMIAVNGVNPYTNDLTADTADGKADKIREDLIALGQYPLWVQSTVQKNPNVTDANKLAFYDYMASHSGDIEYTTQFPGILTLNDGRNGTLVQGTSHTVSRGDMFFTRATSGTSDTCGAATFL